MFAFPKSVRINKQLEFRATLDRGFKIVCPEMIVFGRDRITESAGTTEGATDTTGPRLGLIVSKKVGNAVTRNKVKRFLRESFRKMRPLLASRELLQNKELVIIARNRAAQLSLCEIEAAMQNCLQRLERQQRMRNQQLATGGHAGTL